ncbi:HEPN domain-containing protein [Candidatus Woesearchaeota archaeon]|nr:HEPN domain-containing protein [Candidatus Woesearchaeota archaeon]MBT5271796.1 HEPN domain-containing protein [Candidatus Woesearchaeota archaeon]MBT6040865.1 HEPN domain-containing protein [Candidatus Woesearchaeota archaeon]MBT6336446.1 HEPN domain-containing protein [Candidatus Woesearchaeota archaeon]MBT7926774.1 HEPN domain-containing protein [Candidatus Woesearchaeota archaeon]
MRKMNFLIKLYKEGKLQLVEPSEEIKEAYLHKSSKSLSSAKALLKIGNLEDSVALAYYSMYHCLLALLFRTGIKCENHTGSIILLKNVFEIDNKNISNAKSERVDKQYYVDFDVSKDETKQAIEIAEDFIAEITDFIERLNHNKINDYRNKTNRLLE